MPLLGRRAVHAIRALLELAEAPQRWRSVRDLAEAQQLPEPLLEQLMLRLRRAGLLEARRGRQGGYRLARPAAALPLAAILEALARGGAPSPGAPIEDAPSPGLLDSGGRQGVLAVVLAGPDPELASTAAAHRVTAALERRLRQALERELARCSLEDLHHDLRSARAALSEEGGLLLG